MNKFLIIAALLINLFLLSGANGQVLDPNDGIVYYNEANPPVKPPTGTISKWVVTNRVGWNTSDFKSYFYNGMAFRLRFPENYDPSGNTKYPLIVMLHGRGESGSIYDNEKNLVHGARQHESDIKSGDFNGFLFFPQNTGGFWGSGYFKAINELISDHFDQVNVDKDRVVIHGLSAGGQAVWNYIATYPNSVAAALPMSAASPNYYAGIPAYKYLPIWLSQGGKDRAPTQFTSQALVDEIVAAGGNIRYTVYKNLGHGVWYTHYNEDDFWPFIKRANRTNPSVLSGELTLVSTSDDRDVFEFIKKNEICPGETFEVKLGISPGFQGYEWRKNGLTIQGAQSNELTVSEYGTYDVRFYENGAWSNWSTTPVVVQEKAETQTPDISISGLNSQIIPSPDGKDYVPLELPEGYIAYEWRKQGQSTVLSTSRIYNASEVGSYVATVTEKFGCSSNFSNPFDVLQAVQPSAPSQIASIAALAESKTAIRVQWASNPSNGNPLTAYELYKKAPDQLSFELISVLPATTTSYLDEGLLPNTSYEYQVRPINESTAAAASSIISVKTELDVIAPSSPLNLNVLSTGATYINLSWDASTDDVGVYKYEVYKDGIKVLVTEETSITVFNLNEEQFYQFYIKAKDYAGNSSPESNIVVGVPVSNGVNYKFYEKTWAGSNLPDFNSLTPIMTGNSQNFDISVRTQNSDYGFLFEGMITIPVAGDYTFETRSDDGSKLYIGTYDEANLVVNNDGAHGMRFREGTYSFPSAGSYNIIVSFYQGGGGQGLEVYWKNTAHGVSSRQLIPDSAFESDFVQSGVAPSSPSNFSATALSFDQVKLEWADTLSNETGFQIFRANSNNGPFIPVKILSANSTEYTDSDLTGSTTYYYQIVAFNEFGNSKEVTANTFELGDINSGIAAIDNASGTGYILFSEENVFTRFSSNSPHSSNSDHLIAVKLINNEWFYDNNNNYYSFTPRSYDVLVASVDFSNDEIQSLEGQSSVVNNIKAGYTSGDLTFFANRWNGGGNNGEFTILGTQFSLADESAISVTTLATPPAPSQISDLATEAIDNSTIQISWTDNGDVDEYTLLRSLDNVSFFPLSAELNSSGSSITALDVDLEAHTVYYHTLIAENAGGLTYSDTLSISTMNTVPVMTDITSRLTIRYDSEYDVNLYGTDADEDQLSISGINLPSFASIIDYGDGSGVLRFNPTIDDMAGSPYDEIIVSMSDAFGGIAYDTLSLVINNNHLPELSVPADVSLNEGENTVISLQANDVEGTANLSWSYELPSFAQLNINVDGSAELTLSPGYADHGDYTAVVTVTDVDEASASSEFLISVSDTDPNQVVLVNFTDGSLLGGTNWNNTTGHPSQGDAYNSLVDTKGTVSSFGVSISSNWTNNGSNTYGSVTGDNSGVYPDAVMQSAYWTASATEEVTVTGLDDSKVYNLRFFGSRQASNDRTTRYSVGASSVELNAASNTSQTVSLVSLSPQNGSLQVSISKAGASSYGYLNAMEIIEIYDDGALPAAARNLSASYNAVNSQIELSWSDQAYNERNYKVYRSETEGGVYELLATLNAGSTSYVDTDISANSEYFYQIGSSNTAGETLSELVSVEIPNVAPVITALDDVSVEIGSSLTISVTATDDTGDEISLSVVGLPSFGSFSDLGSGSGLLEFSPLKGEVGVFTIEVLASDGKGQSSETFELSVEEEGLHNYYINFAGSTTYSAPSPWNNYVGGGSAGSSLGNINADVAGENVLQLSLETGWNGYNTSGETGTGLYPDNVTSTALWVSGTQERQMRISGLSTDKAYDFTFYGSRSGGGDRTMQYSINGASVSLNAAYNIENTVSIEGVIPQSDGTILISFEKASSASYGYVNALVVTGYQAASIPATPSNLVATPTDNGAINLVWRDNTNLESAYEVWKSTDNGFNYSLLVSLDADVLNYTDGNSLQSGTTYYYKVRAQVKNGPTAYSNVAGASVYNMVSKINFNAADPQGSPWNNTNGAPEKGAIYTDMKDANNNSTGIAFEVVESNPAYDISLYGFDGDNPFGENTGNNSGVVPDNVMRSTWWMDQGKTAELRFFNLDLSQVYKFSFFASRAGTGNRTSVYTVNGKSVKLNAANNIDNIVSIPNLQPDDNGELVVRITTDDGAIFSYLGAIIISSSNAIDPQVAMKDAVARQKEKGSDLTIAQSELGLYPNPYKGNQALSLNVGTGDSNLEISVISLQGHVIFNQKLNKESELNTIELEGIKNISSGMYLLRVNGDQNGLRTIRFIKQ